MDLRTGETVWCLLDVTPATYPLLSKDADCEIAIIGGGITGALIAYELVKSGVDCLLIDRRDIGRGSTAASTALLLYELDTHLCDLQRRIGILKAASCYQACRDAVKKVGQVVDELGGRCDFHHRTSFYFAERSEDVSALEQECDARQHCRLSADLIRRPEIERLFSFSRPAALVSQDAAEIDVLKFVKLLMNAACAKGLRAFGGTRMIGHDSDGRRIQLQTDAGGKITCRKIVFATGYESEKYLGRKVGTLKSTYAIATEPIGDFRGWHERSLIWTSARPYLYLRTTADDRAIIGGEDIDFEDEEIRDTLLPAKTAKLENHLRALFPEMEFETACAWAGTFGETSDSLARIGETPEMPGAYFALGYGGNGITYAMLAAEIIRDLHFGRKNPCARLFTFDR